MIPIRVLVLGLAAGALGAAGDRPAPPGRVVAPPAATTRAAAAVPRFVLFGWLGPPVAFTTLERYRELAGAGFDLALPAIDDSGRVEDSRARMDAAAASGVRCLTWDRRMRDLDPLSPEGGAGMDTIMADYEDHPGFFGWYFGDEPDPPDWEWLQPYFVAVRARDSAHPCFNNLRGRAAFPTREAWFDYLNAYIDKLQPDILCADHYDFRQTGDVGLYIEDIAGLNAVSRQHGIPYWAVVLLMGHGGFRVPTDSEILWQVSMLLAYAARGVGYFSYWTPPPDPAWNWQPAVIDDQGNRTPSYDLLARFNPRVRAAGETLATRTWQATTHAGPVPQGGSPFVPDGWVRAVSGRAALGMFADSLGGRLLLVANADSMNAQSLELTLERTARVWRLGDRGSWEPLATSLLGGDLVVPLTLPAGDFALLRLDGALGPGARGSRVRVAPVPAAGLARLRVTDVGASGRLEILDGAGRRVWSRALEPGAASVDWFGERDGGGRAPAGVYFVRLEDARGVAVARLTWLGAR